MNNDNTFLRVDLKAWISGAIEKHLAGASWNSAWTKTYCELGGTSVDSGKKSCPMNAVLGLFELGRFIGHGVAMDKNLGLILREQSKNAAYAVAALDYIKANPRTDRSGLWSAVQKRIRNETGEEPAESDQGGAALTLKLWKLGLLQ